MRGLAALVAMGCGLGCINVPRFVGAQGSDDAAIGDGNGPSDARPDAAVGTYISVERFGTNLDGARVIGPDYTMEFSDTGLHFPHQLIVGGQALMGGGETCSDEFGTGIAVYPSFRANGITQGANPQPLDIDLEGPLVARVIVNWGGTYGCGTSSGSPGGYSSFTFFPDGRVMRFDRVSQPEMTTSASCTACGGGFGEGFWLTSFITLQASNATLVGANISALATYGQTVNLTQNTPVCLTERGQEIAIAWRPYSQTRIRVADTTPARTLAFVNDWERDADTLGPAVDEFGNTMMHIKSDGNCNTMATALQPYMEDVGLDVAWSGGGGGVGNYAAPFDDGIFGAQFDPGDVGAPPLTLTTTGTIPPGFALWVNLPASYPDFTFTHSGNPTGTWHEYQRVGNNGVLFWFWSGLSAGETITIEVP